MSVSQDPYIRSIPGMSSERIEREIADREEYDRAGKASGLRGLSGLSLARLDALRAELESRKS